MAKPQRAASGVLRLHGTFRACVDRLVPAPLQVGYLSRRGVRVGLVLADLFPGFAGHGHRLATPGPAADYAIGSEPRVRPPAAAEAAAARGDRGAPRPGGLR